MSEARFKALEARLALVEERLNTGGTSTPSGGDGAMASDSDLDGPYGDEIIKKSPKRWLDDGGADFAGCKMSECPPEFLRAFASLNDWMADRDDAAKKTYTNKKTGLDGPKSVFARKTAARARAWAKRNASMVQGASREHVGAIAHGDDHRDNGIDDSEIPF